jgi:predicted N-acetyltransferase YhbS
VLRAGYFDDRSAFLALADLLRDIFDIDISLLDRFGGPDLTAMPFGWFDPEGRCVANFSAFSMPLVVDGREVRAVGYQSGAVRPDYRGLGLYADLMRRAFEWSDAQGFEAGILLTDKPDLYRPYGFETVPQHAFHGPMPERRSTSDARRLDLDDAADLALAMRLLVERDDLSDVFSARRQTKTFLLNACFDPDIRLSCLPGLEALVAWKVEDGALQLLDLVAGQMPGLGAIVSALGIDASEVQVLFPPDRLGWTGAPQPFRGSCDLMVRTGGVPPAPSAPFMLSPMADF